MKFMSVTNAPMNARIWKWSRRKKEMVMIKRILGYLSNPFTLSWVIFVIALGIYEYWW